MSRRPRDEAAVALAVAEVDRSAPESPALVLADPRPDLVAALRARGVEAHAWSREDAAGGAPPADGAHALVAVRLPRARQEVEMLLHWAAGALRPGGRLWVYGANDEGVKSVPKRLPPFFGPGVTLATGGHARLVEARRSADGPSPRTGLEGWLEAVELDTPWGARPWMSVPGAFAHGRLDEGTALLLQHLPAIRPGARVLDYGAGTGLVAAGVLARRPDARVTGLEPDALAGRAFRLNVPDAALVLGGGWTPLGDARWDVVVSNPPYHRGKDETLAEIDVFLAGLSTRLAADGVMRCVVQRRLPLDARARAAGFESVEPVADAGPYRVWEVRR